MADYDDSTLKGMRAGHKVRLDQVRHFLGPNEEISSDGPAYCVAAPEPYDS